MAIRKEERVLICHRSSKNISYGLTCGADGSQQGRRVAKSWYPGISNIKHLLKKFGLFQKVSTIRPYLYIMLCCVHDFVTTWLCEEVWFFRRRCTTSYVVELAWRDNQKLVDIRRLQIQMSLWRLWGRSISQWLIVCGEHYCVPPCLSNLSGGQVCGDG